MDRRDRSLRESRFPIVGDHESRSFSSTLLDAIYRSIDEDMLFCREKMNHAGFEEDHEEMKMEMEKEKLVRRGFMPDFEVKARFNDCGDQSWMSHSSSTSSDSSSRSGFSSSETESGFRLPSTKPKLILNKQMREPNEFSKAKPAMKIRSDLKRSKQPFPPGCRLTSFLNSLFTTSGTKKTKISTEEILKPKHANTTTCWFASPFSRSCLSNTRSASRSNSIVAAGKRSVKFCPVNIIVDQHYQPPQQKTEYEVDITLPSLESMKHHELERVEEAGRVDDNEEEEEDDSASYSSSDLFELHTLSPIGVDQEQLQS